MDKLKLIEIELFNMKKIAEDNLELAELRRDNILHVLATRSLKDINKLLKIINE